ncbi:Prenyltransferase and squalene oxidase repeat protein [Rosistilla carotiformis]|uniref:Prenyltransferase and squalene oxidase repeat protein n=1 Tax=Rosistilla carotiformis TaxID=2528017 RepID=A0A518JLY6_9BACT|nr:prenyltransferase/squalene oxidase repeat-containing protein [Rosistilla carotiformis]QDV66544.1 Prenyltransferase and squalene oxidase repeat protein [Rosistilla carotiformis]
MFPPSSSRLPSDELPPESDQMWPLDLALVALGGSLMYMAASRLGWEDPRWLYNAKTYAVVIPAGMVLIDLMLRNFVSRYMQRSLQFGFLVSMFVHLVLLILAVNVVIFARYWPEAVVGVQPQRAPVRKTLPDNLFRVNPDTVAEQPDWAKPVDATSEARVTPVEAQRLPRVAEVAKRLEMPTPPQVEHQPQPFLVPRDQPTEAQPTLADAPSKLARQIAAVAPEMRSTTESIQTPDVPQQQAAPQSPQANAASIARTRAAGASAVTPQSAPEMQASPNRSSTIARRNTPQAAPQIQARSDAAAMLRREAQTRTTPSMSAPAAPRLHVARNSERASRQLADRGTGPPRRAATASGASLVPSTSMNELPSSISGSSIAPLASAQRSLGEQAMPAIASNQANSTSPLTGRSRGAARSMAMTAGAGKVQVPQPLGDQGDGETGKQTEPQLAVRGAMAGRATAAADAMASIGTPTPLNIMADDGPAGLGRELAPRMGFPSDRTNDRPMIALQPNQQRFQRRQLGGLTPPPAQRVASVEPFRRRLMRTAGGAAPAPAGLVGPETEEAIERGLAYLAARQRSDGSWTLQGHGEEVTLRSDTAATALCILAFQGAGYTHLKHQHANTVAKAIDYLKRNQSENGDLFRSEDPESNRNVWLYSHSIAALAVCEAFGMTQDPELAEPAQRAIDFIVASQHPTRGGWRYQPQVSSDTSVTGWMTMALKSGELAGLNVPEKTYQGIDRWVTLSQDSAGKPYLFRYNPYALDTPAQRHGRDVTPTMTAVGMLIRMYRGWRRDNPNMEAGAEYLLSHLPELGSARRPQRDTYYWYYATQVMFHMGGQTWEQWNNKLHPLLILGQEKEGPESGSWNPKLPIPDRWSPHGGRLYLTTMNLLSLEIYYRHLPIYEDTAR